MTVVTMKPAEVAHWKSDDFVAYFMRKWGAFHGRADFKFPGNAWLIYGVHVKRFLGKHKLKNEEYRDFVDWVFDFAKAQGKKHVNFLATVDNRMWVFYRRTLRAATDDPRTVRMLSRAEAKSFMETMFRDKYLFQAPEGEDAEN